MLTLFDFIERRVIRPLVRPRPAPTPPPSGDEAALARHAARLAAPPRPPRARPAQARYDALVRDMLARHDVRVHRWRTGMSGVAWVQPTPRRPVRMIEAPRPRGPMSAAVFLHEIGHHALGIGAFSPRCLEEYHAWRFAIDALDHAGIQVTDRVRRRMHESLRYAVAKARRRGLRRLPAELEPFQRPWKPAPDFA